MKKILLEGQKSKDGLMIIILFTLKSINLLNDLWIEFIE